MAGADLKPQGRGEGSIIENKAKRVLASGGAVLAITLNFPHAGMAEYLGRSGFACIVVDGEHGALSDEGIENIARACEGTGATFVLRLPVNDALMQRYLGIGVAGFHIPQIRSAEHARAALDAIKFPPLGRRGLGTFRATNYGLTLGDWPSFIERANAETMVLVAVEDREGLNALPELVRIPEIDVILVGTTDLSADLGFPGQSKHAEVVAAVRSASGIVRGAGKVLGLPASTKSEIDAVYELGATFILTSVTRTFTAGAAPLLAVVGDLSR